MRPYGHARIDPAKPQARATCDACGFIYNHVDLRWRYDWRGTKLQNLRFLVCPSCLDAYQQNGQRTIILPADPIPIQNARPEFRVLENNPLSALGANPNPSLWQYGSQIGTMTNAAGVPAAFDGNTNKPSFMSAMIVVPNSSFENYVGINWSGFPGTTLPASLNSPVLSHTVSDYVITAPNDSIFGSTGYLVQGSPVVADYGSWTTIASGNITGTIGEVLSGTCVGSRFNFHRVAFYGGSTPIAVAQVELNVSDGSSVTG